MNGICAVMPTFNQAAYLREAIDSLAPQVDQLVVVDDGSTDNTRDLVRVEGNVVCFWNGSNLGTATTINNGVTFLRMAMPELEWLTWASSDNAHYPHWAETLLAHAGEDVGMVYSAYDARGDVEPHTNYKPYDPEWLGKSIACYIGPSFIIRADCWPEHRGQHCHDYDHFLRVEEACWSKGLRIVGVPEPLCMYRCHAKQATKNHGGGKFDAPHWLAEAKRRRAALGITPPKS